jgi:dTMP kinase
MRKRSPRGALVVFEGIDGAGKTTQAHRLVESLRKAGWDALYTKEPTDGPWGKKIRRSAESERMPMEEELAAFLADRREHVADLLAPALADGTIVACDRYYFSTAAYQGARGADPAEILRTNEAFAPAPDLLVYVDTPIDLAMARIQTRGLGKNSFENVEALKRSAAIFASIARPYRLDVDGRHTIDELAVTILGAVRERLLPSVS